MKHPSRPPKSDTFSSGSPFGLSREEGAVAGSIPPLQELRVYRDDAALDRVWRRLEVRRRIVSSPRPVTQLFSAVALVAAGVLLGIYIESESVPTELATVTSEVIAVPLGRGQVQEGALQRAKSAGSSATDLIKKKRSHPTTLHSPQSRLRGAGAVLALPEDESELLDATDLALADLEGDEALSAESATEPTELSLLAQPSWSVFADRGEYAAAFQELDQSGGFDTVISSGSSEELMTLVDVARFVGRQGRAIQALRAVTQRFQGDANAPLAAMILGNLLSRAGDAAGAAEAYALNRQLSPGGDFAEDALVREFDMALADGDLASVERLQSQYATEFPEGRHSSDLRARRAKLAARISQGENTEGEEQVSGDREGRESPPETDAETPVQSGAIPSEGSTDKSAQD